MTFDDAGMVSVFETTIRVLGGLLSAFELSGEKVSEAIRFSCQQSVILDARPGPLLSPAPPGRRTWAFSSSESLRYPWSLFP